MSIFPDQLFEPLPGDAGLWMVAAIVVAILVVGTVVRVIAVGRAKPEVARDRLSSLGTWWGVMLTILAMALAGPLFATVAFTVISLVAWSEFARLRREAISTLPLRIVAMALIVVSYLWIWGQWPAVFVVFLPVAGWLLPCALAIWSSRPQGYLAQVSQSYWGLIVTAYAPAHAVLLFTLPTEANPVAGGGGWLLFLLLLTEMNDIAQALVGRRIGKRRLSPQISPNKTWAGFVGGLLFTMVLAAVLSPWLIPWQPLAAAAAGAVIAACGLLGDLNISALKRECGVKDSSNLLPGQGGILDRIDSLSFSAPVFYYIVWSQHTSGMWGP